MTPFRQGDLDWLCSLYSIVHAVHVAVHRRPRRQGGVGASTSTIPLRCFDKCAAYLSTPEWWDLRAKVLESAEQGQTTKSP